MTQAQANQPIYPQANLNHDRARAPLSPKAWSAIDDAATHVLNACLSARRICDVVQTQDWTRSALPLGSAHEIKTSAASTGSVFVREARPLLELRVPLSLNRSVVRELHRESPVADLSAVADAAREFARIEDAVIYDGVEAIGAPGLRTDSEQRGLPIAQVQDVPGAVARAVESLRSKGVDGPYCFVPSSAMHTALLSETLTNGQPVMDHVRRNVQYVGTPAQNFEGALVCSRRGGDFRLHLGRGAHLVFEWEDADEVHLAMVQTMALEFGGRDAIVALEAPSAMTIYPSLAPRPAAPAPRTPAKETFKETLALGLKKVESTLRSTPALTQ